MEGMESVAGGFFDEEAAVTVLGAAAIALRDGLHRLRSQYGSKVEYRAGLEIICYSAN